MKRILSVLICTFMLTGVLSACGSQNTENTANTDTSSEKLSIVTTIFPEYDWVREIMGNNADMADITLLLDDGADLHSYQPTVDDIVKISTCDMFIYVGGESDRWVADALKEATNEGMVVINLLDVLGDSVKAEETVEGMQAEEHEHDDAETSDEDEVEYDEHVWLSLKNASRLCSEIASRLADIDPDNSAVYLANAEAYIKLLNELDAQYKEAVDSAETKTLLFGDRFPFRYMADDYDLDYYAAFAGCSAETEASFETIAFLSGKADELGLGAVLTIETSDQRIAATIIDNTANKDQQILTMDSMQSTAADDIVKGITYLDIMKGDLEVLKTALN